MQYRVFLKYAVSSFMLGTCLMLVSRPAMALDHVLIMTISQYPSAPALPGVTHDADNALQLIDKLGIDSSRAIVLRDKQANAQGIRNAFQALASSVNSNDRVFVYYSGHGFSAKQGNNCVQGIVAQDETLIDTAELTNMLANVRDRMPSEALVIFDACHSGGNRDVAITGTRSIAGGKDTEGVHAKVWTPKGGEGCANPVNILAKTFDNKAKARGIANPENNFTFIAAANEREIALDDRDKGGVATTGLLQCVNHGVTDTDHSGGISYREWAGCAQQYIKDTVPKISQYYTPHQLEIYGNLDRTIAVAANPSTTQINNALNTHANQVRGAFQEMEANANANWGFDARFDKERAPMGSTISLNYSSQYPGYVYALYVGSDNRDVQQLYPSPGHHILQGVTTGKSRELVQFSLEAPAGENSVLVLMSKAPMNLSRVLKEGSIPVSLQALQEMQCLAGETRNLKVKGTPTACNSNATKILLRPSSSPVDGYAAMMLKVEGY